MTTIAKSLILLVILTAALVTAAAAQVPSLANIGGDVYTSKADGFEIAVPINCVKVSDGQRGRNYNCTLKEGDIFISIAKYDDAITTDAEVAVFLKGFKDTLLAADGVKYVGETSAKVGNYHGASYKLTVDGEPTLAVALVWSTFVVTISGRAKSEVEHSADLIGRAVESFAFVSPGGK